MHPPRPLRKSSTLLASAALAASALAVPGTAEAAIRTCTVAAVQSLAPAGTTITAAVRTAGPDHCLVDGHVTVTSPGPWNIKFRLALPDHFAGRHFFFAQGGSGGGIVPWTGQDEGNAAAPLDYDFNELMGRGFTVVAMDKGTAPLHALDFSWQTDPVQKLNWDNRALETIAAATQGLTRSFYRTRTLHRYVSGCSGGGMGSINNLRVHDGRRFDGVIVGSTVPLSPTSALGSYGTSSGTPTAGSRRNCSRPRRTRSSRRTTATTGRSTGSSPTAAASRSATTCSPKRGSPPPRSPPSGWRPPAGRTTASTSPCACPATT
jgi:hypothetical protein